MPANLSDRTRTLMMSTVHSLSNGLHRVSRGRLGEAPPDRQRLLVIGNGMVGHRFLRTMVEIGGIERYEVIVFGEEPRPAYDRVNLTSLVKHGDPRQLLLSTREWYAASGIQLQTGAQVTAVDTTTRDVQLLNGRRFSYDHLIFATGSTPFVPPIPGRDLPGVFVYRTVEDLQAIIAASQSAGRAAVIGGGLLGLEAARALVDLGVHSHVIEMADGLMPQQLDPPGAALLRDRVTASGVEIHLSHRTAGIEKTATGLRVTFAAHDPVDVDLIVISTGIRPRADLAEAAGLECLPRQGIVCGADLQTSAPSVYAIGECACAAGTTYGLAAPGYKMADILARRLMGSQQTFDGCDLSTRLKMMDVDVAVYGDYLQPGTLHTYAADGVYRKLVLQEGRLIGAIAVGAWSQANRLQGEVQARATIRHARLEQFDTEGDIWPDAGDQPVGQWPADTIVCNCMSVTRGTISAACARGCETVDAVGVATGAGTVCGSCKPLVAELVGAPVEVGERATGLLIASALGLLAVMLIGLAAPLSYALSVQDPRYVIDALWRDNFLKQVSGYSLLGLAVFGLVLSVRKRIKIIRFGKFGTWRTVHAVFGFLALGALISHTGFHFGANMNQMLMTLFVCLNLLGAVAGGVAAIESVGSGRLASLARRHRRWLTWAHLLLVWPLPPAVGIHIATVYYF